MSTAKITGLPTVLGIDDHAALDNLDYASSGHTGFVQAEEGKGLSSNDYTTLEKDKLAGIKTGYETLTEEVMIDHENGWAGIVQGTPNPFNLEDYAYYKINIIDFTVPNANYKIILPLQEERKAYPCEFYSKIDIDGSTGELTLYAKKLPTESFEVIVEKTPLAIGEVGIGIFVTPNRFPTKAQVGLGNAINPTIYGTVELASNLDTIVYSGFYTCYSGTDGLSAEMNSLAVSFFVTHENSSVGVGGATQYATAFVNTSIVTFVRVKLSSVWGNWINTSVGLKENAIKKFSAVEVLATDFVADTTYTDYGFRATVPLTGVVTTDIPNVNFSGVDIALEIFAPFADSYAGGIYIYATEVPSATITIPNIYCVVGV